MGTCKSGVRFSGIERKVCALPSCMLVKALGIHTKLLIVYLEEEKRDGVNANNISNSFIYLLQKMHGVFIQGNMLLSLSSDITLSAFCSVISNCR